MNPDRTDGTTRPLAPLPATKVAATGRHVVIAARSYEAPPTPGYRASDPPTPRDWLEYSRRKNALPPMSGEDYDDAVRVILLELGL